MLIGSSTDNQEDDTGAVALENTSDNLGNNAGLETGADSSTAQDDNKPKDMESAVRRALGAEKGEQSSSSGDNGEGGTIVDPLKAAAPNAQQPANDDSDLTDAEMNLLKPRTRRSFERMRGQLSDAQQRLEHSEPAMQKLTEVQNFCTTAGLSDDDVNQIFTIGAAVRNDPEKALGLLMPVVSQLMTIVGEVLPPDLQQQVREGKIPLENAQEISRLRARDTRNQQRQTQNVESQRQQEHRDAIESAATAAGTAVSDLDKQWAASDPDYRVKSARIAERIELNLLKAQSAGRLPTNAKEAVEMAKAAKAEVDAEFKRFLPQKRQVQSVMGVQTSTGSKPAPKNLKEAIQQSVGQ